MKHTLKLAIFVFIVFIIIIMFGEVSKYKVGELYSENYIEGYISQNIQTETYVTREWAIDRAIEVFKNGFGVDIDRNNLLERVELYENKSGLQWYISWRENSSAKINKEYACEIYVETGEIESIGLYSYMESETGVSYIDEDIVIEIIKPLSDELGIELEINNMKIVDVYKNNVTIDFYKDKNYECTFSIDYINKKNVFFRKQYYKNYRGE